MVDRKRDFDAYALFDLLAQKLQRVQQRRHRHRRSVAAGAGQLLANADRQRPRNDADLGENVASQVGDQGVVDPHGALEMAAAAGGAVVERLGHLLDLVIGQARIAQQPRPQNARDGEVPPINGQQQLRAVARKVLLVARRQVDLALDGAARALRADADVVIQGQAVVGVLQDGGEGLQETAGAVLTSKSSTW